MLDRRVDGFRLGICVCEDAGIVGFTARYGVFTVARRWRSSLDVFLVAEAMWLVQAQAGFTVLPNYSFNDRPARDAFLIPADRPPGAARARRHHQPGSDRRRRQDHHGGWHQLGHRAGLLPAPPRRLRGGLLARGGA